RSVAETTSSRTWSCSSRMASSRCRASRMTSLVMDIRKGQQLRCLCFGQRIAQEIATADLRTCEVLQEVRFAERRVALDVEMKSGIVGVVSGRLMQREDVRKRHLPQVVVADKKALERHGELVHLSRRHCRKAGVRLLWRDVALVRVPSEVG